MKSERITVTELRTVTTDGRIIAVKSEDAVNGQQKSTSSDVTTFRGIGNIQIASFNGANNFLNGDIAHALVYNRSLTASEILENFNNLKSRFGL